MKRTLFTVSRESAARQLSSKSRSLRASATLVLLMLCGAANANFACFGPVGYLGVGAGAELTVQVAGQTPIHVICNLNAQGSYALPVASCKAAYSMLLLARLTGKNVGLYYSNDALNCSTLPSWGAVPSTYFVEGPNG